MKSRITDQLAATLTGMLAAIVLMAMFVPDAWAPTPRPSQHADPRSPRGMTTDGSVTVPLPDVAGRTAAPDVPSGVAPAVELLPASGAIKGTATWFDSPAGVSAAGPALRRALPGWRGQMVLVCGDRCARTVLGDWMAADKLIDLHAPVFQAVCGPLSRGVCRVTVSWPVDVPAPPDTAKGDAP